MQDPQEPIIDPDLIGLTATARHESEPAAPTVPRKNAKKPTKGKKPAKAKSKPVPRKGKNTDVVPEDIEDNIEPPEPTITIMKPRPRPVPKNPHLIGNHTEMAQPDQSGSSGELPSARVPSMQTFPPIQEFTSQAPPTPSFPPIQDIPTPSNLTTAPPVQATPTDSALLGGPSRTTEAPTDSDALPGQSGLTESAESGRPKRQPAKRKLDACLALQFKVAEKEAEKKRLQLEAARRKCQCTK